MKPLSFKTELIRYLTLLLIASLIALAIMAVFDVPKKQETTAEQPRDMTYAVRSLSTYRKGSQDRIVAQIAEMRGRRCPDDGFRDDTPCILAYAPYGGTGFLLIWWGPEAPK